MADFDVKITTTMRELGVQLDRLIARQLPFATALALTRSARDARDKARKDHARRFARARAKGFAKFSIRATRAEKRDWPDVTAAVGSVHDFMVLQETGGTKRAARSGEIAIPTSLIRRTARGAVTKAQRPSRVLKRKGVARLATAKGHSIVRRPSKRARGGHLSLLYLQRSSVRVKKAKPTLHESIQKGFERAYPGRFLAALNEAINTRKKP